MEAADAEEWAEACQYEMDALSKNDTWELVNLPPGHKAIKSKWVFKLKADGHFRAHLVAKGFMQIPGIDYDETFSHSSAKYVQCTHKIPCATLPMLL